MNRTISRPTLWLLSITCFCIALSMPASAQWNRLKEVKKAVKAVAGEPEQDKKPVPGKSAKPGAAAGGTSILFSESPIDPASPGDLTTDFKSGRHIYGLIQIDKTWRALLGKGRKDATKIEVPIDLLVDGKRTEFQYIIIKKAEAIDSNHLIFDIAPEPSKMTAYKDPGFFYPEGKGNRKIGPDTYTYNLAELSPGQHTIRFQIRSYGDIFSAGEFTIVGDDYGFYSELREKILAQAFAVETMPQAKKTDKALEANMRKLLDNAGWKNIRKLVIVDKDWWNDLVDGGNSAVKSRHMAAAVAAKADDGSFFYCICTFHQQKLITGAFGPLELTHTGDRKPILEENIDK